MDGTAIHAAAAHGYGQQVFKPPCSIYHQVFLLFRRPFVGKLQ
jgi:hypothetical protein